MRARFDRSFKRRTGFATLDRLLARLYANKAELLMVLDRPEIPLHTNGSEKRHPRLRHQTQGQRRTRSDRGRDCRDAFLSLVKTCDRLGIPVLELSRRQIGRSRWHCDPLLPQLVGQRPAT